MKSGLTSTAGRSVAFVVFVAMAWIGPSLAAETVHVRGTVATLEGSTLMVKTREGPTAAVTLKPGFKVSGVVAASLGDIKPGDFVGVASLPRSSGGDGAIEVLVFPAAMKGTGEGSYPWDLKPKSTMTNGTVANEVKGVDGRMLTLAYKGGERKVSVADGTPIVTFAPATEADLKPGATVFVPAQRGADGALSAGFVAVGTNGVAPPM